MEFCRSVRLVCREPPDLIPMWVEVSPGQLLPGTACRIGFCSPTRCVLAPFTTVATEPWIEHRVRELEHNMAVELRFPGAREVYVYPKKVWNEISKRLLEPMSQGRPPREQGAILCGPPGTGKTSMAQIIATILGLYVVSIEPQKVLSKWVGETEQRISQLLDEAERNEPSVVLMDDAEWAVRSRELHRGEDTAVYLGMMNILLRKLQSWSRSGRLAIAIVTTNVSVELIDVALRRSGRLGRPIFVPLPDFEAVHTILLEHGVRDPEAERLAVEIVNAGLPMSDAVSIAKRVASGERVDIEPIKARGYVRPVPPRLEWETAPLRSSFSWLCPVIGMKGVRLWIEMDYTVAIPIALTIAGIVCKRPCVVVTDPRHLDEAANTAETCDATLVVPTDVIPKDYQRAVLALATTAPIIFVGREPPSTRAIPLKPSMLFRRIEAKKALISSVLRYYVGNDGREIAREAERLARASDENVEAFLTALALSRNLEVAKRILPVV